MRKRRFRASALAITLFFILLLGVEALVVSLFLTRSIGGEAALRGQNANVKAAADLAVNTLRQSIYTQLSTTGQTPLDAWNTYKRGGTDPGDIDTLADRYTSVNPESGSSAALGIQTAAWIQEYRGNYFHLVGRAQKDNTDIVSHRWLFISPCTPSGLVTILTNAREPGSHATMVDNTGRVFFSNENEDGWHSTNFFTWHASTGLSSLLPSNRIGVGANAAALTADGRVFFGSSNDMDSSLNTDGFWTWKDGKLSTLIDNIDGAGRWYINSGKYTLLDSRTGRIYFGTKWRSNIYTWKEGDTSPTQIMTDPGGGGDWKSAGGRMVLGTNDELYFTDDYPSWRLYKWSPANGLTSLVFTSVSDLRTMGGDNNGQIWIAEYAGSKRLWTYKNGTLTTIAGTGYGHPEYWEEYNKPGRIHAMANGNVFLTTDTTAYFWNPSTPTALTAVGGGQAYTTAINSNNTMVAYADDASASKVRVWSQGNILSTIAGSYDSPAYQEGMVWNGNMLYFGAENTPGLMMAWNASTQKLSTLLNSASIGDLGIFGGTAVDPTSGNVYFGTPQSSGGAFYMFNPTTQAVTSLVTGRASPGGYIGQVAINPYGGVYFGEGAASTSNFYYYNPTSSCDSQ